MKITVSALALMGSLSISHASPHPNSGVQTTTPPHIVSSTFAASSGQAFTTTFPPSAVPIGTTTPSSGYPSPGYDCVPIGNGYSSIGYATTSPQGGAVTVTFTSSATPATVHSSTLGASSSHLHENWGKHSSASTSLLIYPTAVTSTYAACPPGYTPSYGGTASAQPVPVGTTTAVPAPPPVTTSASSTSVASGNSQNLNGPGDVAKPGAAVSSFKVPMAGSILASIAAAAWLI